MQESVKGGVAMIRLEHVSKSFCGRRALKDVTLTLPRGEVVGLLGANGAGKSTLLGILLGLVVPDVGEAFINSVSVQRDRRRALRGMGAVFEQAGFAHELSGRENMAMLASCSGCLDAGQIEDAARFTGLSARIDDRVGTYSRGMRLRLAIAQALVPRPEIVVLDEPMEGLDPLGIRDVRELIGRMRDEFGATVILSSHLLSEVEPLCDSVAILHEGRLLFSGSWSEAASTQRRVRLELNNWTAADAVLARLGVQRIGGSTVELADGFEPCELIAALVADGIRVNEAEELKPTLESKYIEILSGA